MVKIVLVVFLSVGLVLLNPSRLSIEHPSNTARNIDSCFISQFLY